MQTQPQALSAAARPELSPWREALRQAWAVYLPMRIILTILAAVAAVARWRLNGETPQSLGGWLHGLLLAPWNHYDVEWYVKIASGGYGIADGRGVFHPLLPLLMGLVGRLLGGQYVLAGLIVTDIACIGAMAAFYRLVELDHGRSIARETISWLLYIPVGMVLLLPYTESLMLCFTLLAFWFSRHDRWLAAGLCGALATLAKQPGLVLAPALFIGYAYQHRHSLAAWRTIRVMASLSLIPLAYLAVSMYVNLAVNPDAVSSGGIAAALSGSDQLKTVWRSQFAPPWRVLERIVRFSFGPDTDWVYWVEMVLGALALVVAVLALRHVRLEERVYSVIQVGLISTILLATEPLLSLPRRFILVFPIFIQLAIWSQRNPARGARWRALSMSVMLLLAVAFFIQQFIP
jgi:hypothetical protein